MASFHLRAPSSKIDSSGSIPIYLVFNHQGKKFKLFTGVKILAENWDAKRQLVVNFDGETIKLNESLIKQKQKLKEAFEMVVLEEDTSQVNVEAVKEKFNSLLFENASKFYQEFLKYIELSKIGKKPSTVLVYDTLIRDIYKFEVAFNYPIDFNTINQVFYDSFTEFLEINLNNTHNTVIKKIKALKAFLHHGSSKKLISRETFSEFDTKTIDSVKIALTEQELAKIYNLNLAQSKELALMRDLFCFGCFTGLKFSEIISLKQEDIKDYKIIIENQYTKIKTRIPLNNYAQIILYRYAGKGNNCFPSLQNVYANKFIKELGKLAEIKTPTEIAIHKRSTIIRKVKPKHELITTDTARYTYAVISLRSGMRPELLIQVLGQKTINSLLEYCYFANPAKDFEMIDCWNKKYL